MNHRFVSAIYKVGTEVKSPDTYKQFFTEADHEYFGVDCLKIELPCKWKKKPPK